jgi:squalene-hopene/tetraprenyl-beta-curcumene cyclase
MPQDPVATTSSVSLSESGRLLTQEEARTRAVRALLAARTPAGHWEGELSSSALSTATAIFALSQFSRSAAAATSPELASACPALVAAGVRWLLENQNADGGWGDTTHSVSNISTTALCWAALSGAGDAASGAIPAAEAWLTRVAGSLGPEDIARAITARYGKDRTFSVPILTMCALAGRLGEGPWRLVAQLPFELAAFPQSWFRFFRLPVVSYALPALIGMGLVRHRRLPTANPFARTVRDAAADRALRTLAAIQPENGGFLEATPLTGFVAMSLIGGGFAVHPVVRLAVQFLVRSARADGSWPIDTNLATWVTTLAINALSKDGRSRHGVEGELSVNDRRTLREWLLVQQFRERHPYTGAAPGGWGWTNRPGAVPDADDTAGALIALRNLEEGGIDTRTSDAAAAGVRWLLDLQNGDGGIPTFCRGWTKLPFDRSGPDLTAHALLAWNAWIGHLPEALSRRTEQAMAAAVKYLVKTQREDGSWLPLWFGNQHSRDDENPTYGTSRVLTALCEVAGKVGGGDQRLRASANRAIGASAGYLASSQSADGGWGGSAGTPTTVEETALATTALKRAARNPCFRTGSVLLAVARGEAWLTDRLSRHLNWVPSPIGFYFAKLWYAERMYPTVFAVGALAFE